MEGVKLKEHEHLSADEPHAASAHLLKHWYIIQCLHNSAQSSSSCDGVKERSLWTPEIIRFELQNPTKKKKGGKSLSMIINIIKWPEAEQNCITKLTSEHPYLPATPTHPAVPPPQPLFSTRISRSMWDPAALSSSLLQNHETAIQEGVWWWRTESGAVEIFTINKRREGGRSEEKSAENMCEQIGLCSCIIWSHKRKVLKAKQMTFFSVLMNLSPFWI